MYVEVIYLKDMKYDSRKWVYCSNDEARTFYGDAVAMMKDEKIQCLVCLRDDDHIVVTSCLLYGK